MMDAKVYNSQEWRDLPRDGECVVSFLFGARAGACRGLIHRHHVDPPDERTVQICARHHPQLEAALRQLDRQPHWRHCPHTHRSREARLVCERRLNRLAAA